MKVILIGVGPALLGRMIHNMVMQGTPDIVVVDKAGDLQQFDLKAAVKEIKIEPSPFVLSQIESPKVQRRRFVEEPHIHPNYRTAWKRR